MLRAWALQLQTLPGRLTHRLPPATLMGPLSGVSAPRTCPPPSIRRVRARRTRRRRRRRAARPVGQPAADRRLRPPAPRHLAGPAMLDRLTVRESGCCGCSPAGLSSVGIGGTLVITLVITEDPPPRPTSVTFFRPANRPFAGTACCVRVSCGTLRSSGSSARHAIDCRSRWVAWPLWAPTRHAYSCSRGETSAARGCGGNARVNVDPSVPVRTSAIASLACAMRATMASPSPAPGIPRAAGAR